MVCARCGQWVENQWLFWVTQPHNLFWPPDVQFVTPLFRLRKIHDTVQLVQVDVSYFYCARCTIAKYEDEMWTPGQYVNEDGSVCSDEDDDYFLFQRLPYCVYYLRRHENTNVDPNMLLILHDLGTHQ